MVRQYQVRITEGAAARAEREVQGRSSMASCWYNSNHDTAIPKSEMPSTTPAVIQSFTFVFAPGPGSWRSQPIAGCNHDFSAIFPLRNPLLQSALRGRPGSLHSLSGMPNRFMTSRSRWSPGASSMAWFQTSRAAFLSPVIQSTSPRWAAISASCREARARCR